LSEGGGTEERRIIQQRIHPGQLRRQPQHLLRQQRLPQRHLIAYGTEHGLDPFSPKGRGHPVDDNAKITDRHAGFSGRSSYADGDQPASDEIGGTGDAMVPFRHERAGQRD
jgi:hypothetical protein